MEQGCYGAPYNKKTIRNRINIKVSDIVGYEQSLNEAGRGAAARGVAVKPTGCGFHPHSRS